MCTPPEGYKYTECDLRLFSDKVFIGFLESVSDFNFSQGFCSLEVATFIKECFVPKNIKQQKVFTRV